MTRTSWCGQVSAPKESTSSASSRSDGSCPSGPPMAMTSAAAAAVAQSADPFGEILGGEILAALVEQDQRGALAQLRPQPVGFLALCARRRSARGLRQSRQRRRIRGRSPGRSWRSARNSGRQAPSRGRPSCGPRHERYSILASPLRLSAESSSGSSRPFGRRFRHGSVDRLFLEIRSLPHLFEL